MVDGWEAFLKVYGPMSIGWLLAGYLGKFLLDHLRHEVEAKLALARALDSQSAIIERLKEVIETCGLRKQ